MLTAVLKFPGLDHIVSWSISGWSHGITPTVITVEALPSPSFIPGVGEIEISFGTVQIAFPDSALSRSSLEISRGGQVWSLSFLDRRWKWQFGEISGRFNIHQRDGSIEDGTERTLEELADLCLEALSEENADTSRLPAAPRPEVDWQFANPAKALADLLDPIGFRLILRHQTDRVELWPVGEGANLPIVGLEQNITSAVKASVIPDELKLVAGPTVFQAKIILEAVGEDVDGSIKRLEDLSYNPDADGDGFQSPVAMADVEIDEGDERELALRSVYRWYRVRYFHDETLVVPGFDGDPLESIDQILPIRDVQAVMVDGPDGEKMVAASVLEGTFSNREMDDGNSAKGTKYARETLQIDRETGIVKLPEFLVRMPDTGYLFKEPEVVLVTSFNVRDNDGKLIRETREKDLPGDDHETRPAIIKRPDLFRVIVQNYGTGDEFLEPEDLDDNEEEIKDQADAILDEKAAEYDRESAADVQYAGIWPFELDGAIQQISWTMGSTGATTRVSRNEEFDTAVPRHRERRRREKVEPGNEQAEEVDVHLRRDK